MKIVQFISSLEDGGAENLVKDYAIELAKRGHKVYVVTTDRRDSGKIIDSLRKSKVNIVHLGNTIFENAIQWKRFLRQTSPDIIHGHLNVGQFLFMAPRRTGLFYTFHSKISAYQKAFGWKFDLYTNLIVKRNAIMIALDTEMVQEAKRLYKTEKVVFLENCVNVQRFRDAIPIPGFREELGIPDGALVIGHVGRFVSVKNHQKLISVFNEVLKLRPDAHLIMVGTGILQAEISNRITELGLNTKAHMLGSRSDVERVLKDIDVFVLPSFIEGFPITVTEAQAAGIRIVASYATPVDAIRSDHFVRLDVNEADEIWANEIVKPTKVTPKQANIEDCDINTVISKLEKMYYSTLNKSKQR